MVTVCPPLNNEFNSLKSQLVTRLAEVKVPVQTLVKQLLEVPQWYITAQVSKLPNLQSIQSRQNSYKKQQML